MARVVASSVSSLASTTSKAALPVRKYKVILLGEVGSGKRSLIRRLRGDGFVEYSGRERGDAKCIFSTVIDECKIELEIEDPAGMDRLGSLTRNYYMYAKGVVMVYDTTEATTLSQISKWRNEVSMYLSDEVTMLLGNKFDNMSETNAEHADLQEKAEDMVRKHNFVLHELVSCKTGVGVTEAFEKLARVLYRFDVGSENPFKDDDAVKKSIVNVKKPPDTPRRRKKCNC